MNRSDKIRRDRLAEGTWVGRFRFWQIGGLEHALVGEEELRGPASRLWVC